jgi:hypothetical protein
MNCEFCNKIFSNKSSLNNHKKTAKYCIKLQTNKIPEIINFYCEYCNKKFTSKQSLNIHLSNCKDREVQEKLKEKDRELQEKLKEKDIDLFRSNTQSENYKVQIEKLEKREIEYKEQINDLQNKLDKIANKAIDKPTTFTTTNNTINNKFELNTFPSQKEIDRKIESQFNDKYILDGMKGIAQFVFDHIVKLEDGSMAYACYDTSRQIFKYKDERGNEIKDPKAVKLRKMIKPGLLRQSQTLLDYFNDECDYLEKRKDNGQDIDGKEYNMMNTLREKAFEVGCDILSIEETNKFSNELANLSCV